MPATEIKASKLLSIGNTTDVTISVAQIVADHAAPVWQTLMIQFASLVGRGDGGSSSVLGM